MEYPQILEAAKSIGLANLSAKTLAARLNTSPRAFGNWPALEAQLIRDGVPLGELAGPRPRLNPGVRANLLRRAALELAREVGVLGVTAGAVAKRVGVSRTLAQVYIAPLPQTIAAAAIAAEDAAVLAECLRLGVTGARDAPPVLLTHATNLMHSQL